MTYKGEGGDSGLARPATLSILESTSVNAKAIAVTDSSRILSRQTVISSKPSSDYSITTPSAELSATSTTGKAPKKVPRSAEPSAAPTATPSAAPTATSSAAPHSGQKGKPSKAPRAEPSRDTKPTIMHIARSQPFEPFQGMC